MFCCWQVLGMQLPPSMYPHWLGTPPPPHVCGGVHGPQSSMLPQPSPAGPQPMFCCAQVCGVQEPPSVKPHWSGTPPPPHVCGGVHGPQLSMLPQPSPAGPQPMFCCAHVKGVQVGGAGGPGTHEARSQMRYSSAFSCGDIGAIGHSSGNVCPIVLP